MRLLKRNIIFFLDTYDQYKQNVPMSQIRLKGCLTILIAKIMELYGCNQYRGEFIQDTTKQKLTKYLDKLQPVFNFAHEHLHQSLSVGELAIVSGMSEKYFISYFKNALGITPGRYIYQLKMNRARELLYSKQYSIKEIASMLGYPDPYSFSKAFKKNIIMFRLPSLSGKFKRCMEGRTLSFFIHKRINIDAAALLS